jgi:hypothetical protein
VTARACAALAALALVAGCAPAGVATSEALCALAPEAEVAAALGVAVAEVFPQPDDHPACRWTGAPSPDGVPRTMTADLWREKALQRARTAPDGAAFFEEQLHLLERDYGKTRVIGGLGEAAVYGFGEVGDERFSGAIIVRRDGDVLSMRIEGEDPGAFEAVAREVAAGM